MHYFDFKVRNFYKSNKFQHLYITYFSKDRKELLKDIYKAISVQQSSFRSAKLKDFVGHDAIMNALSNYYDLRYYFDYDKVMDLDRRFNEIFTCYYYMNYEKMESIYQELQYDREYFKDSIYDVIYEFIEFFYVCLNANIKDVVAGNLIVKECIEKLNYFDGKLYDELNYLISLCKMRYYSNITEEDNFKAEITKAFKFGEYFPKLLNLTKLYASLGCYKLKDYMNAALYSIEAIRVIDEDMNQVRSIIVRGNLAMCYEQINHVYEAIEIINKLLLLLNVIESNQLNTLLYLIYYTKAICLIKINQFEAALEETANCLKYLNRMDIVVTKLYCFYKLNDKESFEALYKEIKIKDSNKETSDIYLMISNLFLYIYTKAKRKMITNQYKFIMERQKELSNSRLLYFVEREMTEYINRYPIIRR